MNKVFYFLCLSALCSMIQLGCKPARQCSTLETRCKDNKVEICNPDGQWVMMHNCTDDDLYCYVQENKEAHCLQTEIIMLPPENKDLTND